MSCLQTWHYRLHGWRREGTWEAGSGSSRDLRKLQGREKWAGPETSGRRTHCQQQSPDTFIWVQAQNDAIQTFTTLYSVHLHTYTLPVKSLDTSSFAIFLIFTTFYTADRTEDIAYTSKMYVIMQQRQAWWFMTDGYFEEFTSIWYKYFQYNIYNVITIAWKVYDRHAALIPASWPFVQELFLCLIWTSSLFSIFKIDVQRFFPFKNLDIKGV